MSRNRGRRSASAGLALSLCMILPAVAGTAPGAFETDTEAGCSVLPCLKWTGLHDSPDDQAAAHHVALSPDGATAYVVGGTFTWATSTDLVTWAIDVASGEPLWSAAYDGGSDEDELWFHDVRAITVSPDGATVAVAGTSQGSFGHRHDIVTIAYDAATGAPLWTDRFNGPDSFEDSAAAVVVDPTGTYVVTAGGMDDRSGGRSGILLGYELATGQRLWERPFDSDCGDSDVLGLRATPGARAVFAGGLRSTCLSDTSETPQDADLTFTPTVWAVDPATGAVLWEAQDLDPTLTLQSAVFLGALEATDDRVVLATRITNPRNRGADLDVLTMAVDLSGAILWTARYDSLGRDDLLGMRVDPDGSTYVVATSPALPTAGQRDQNRDVVVVAYRADGQPAWITRLDSSTTGLQFNGAAVGGEGDDSAPISAPALFESGTRLAIGYEARVLSPVPILGPVGAGVQATVVLDTGTGAVVATRSEDQRWSEFSYAALHDRADFVAVGSFGEGFTTSASIRRFSMDVTPPDLDLPSSVHADATGPDGAVVVFDAAAEDDRDGMVPVTCSPASGSIFPPGATDVACEATDSYGNAAAGTFRVTVQDTRAPVLHVPGPLQAHATRADGAPVTFDVTADDAVDADPSVACSHAPGQVFPPGTTSVTCSATDAAGNSAEAGFEVAVTYDWTGFQAPLAEDELRWGRSVPVKVSLRGASAGIEDAAFSLWIVSGGGTEVPAIGRGGAQGNRLAYDAGSGVYQINWDTSTVLPGEHLLRLDLGDGTVNTIRVHLGR